MYKPPGWTSFDVVRKIRSATNERKVGHGGTLDPFAEGVLIIGTGKDTKRLNQISRADKSYTGIIKLGVETDTLDIEGKVIKNAAVPLISEIDILHVFKSYTGTYNQIPPMYSAKRVQGIRLYKLARKNIEIERQPVPVEIRSLKLDKFVENEIFFSVICSKGTYIRVLAADIAKSLGTVGHLVKLVRTSVGDFSVKDAMTIDTFLQQ